MKKEEIISQITKEMNKGRCKTESFNAYQSIRSYFVELSMEDLRGIAGQYGTTV